MLLLHEFNLFLEPDHLNCLLSLTTCGGVLRHLYNRKTGRCQQQLSFAVIAVIILMIKLSSQGLFFDYVEGRHLSTSLTISNLSNDKFMYFKMKVSRQKYFMVKPDKGSIPPQSSQTLDITIHKEITQSYQDDQLQLIYTFDESQMDKFPLNLFSDQGSYSKKKLEINIKGGAPSHLSRRKHNENEFLSVVNSANEQVFSSGNIRTLINEAEGRVRKLQEDLEMYKGMSKQHSTMSSVKKRSKFPILILSLVSLGLGYVVGFFI